MEKGIICKAPEKGYCFIRSQTGERIFGLRAMGAL